jgi:hypothetical protein
MRAWVVSAGVRTAEGGGPAAPRWVLTKDHRPQLLAPADDATDDWLLVSGEFVAGHVHRPAGGPRRDPHWMLLGKSTTECRAGVPAGPTTSMSEEYLLGAWQAWLEWAELQGPAPTSSEQ